MVREIDSGTKNAGAHHLVWDGKNVSGRKAPNGVYLIRLASGSVSATQRVTILR
jgi:flagellar hook assembly protein FlgD